MLQLCNPSGRLKPRAGGTNQPPVTEACSEHPQARAACCWAGEMVAGHAPLRFGEPEAVWQELGNGKESTEGTNQQQKLGWQVRVGVIDLEESEEMGTG